MTSSLTWKIVDDAAAELGASDAARLKWRQRGVPPIWQIKITEHLVTGGAPISIADFDMLQRTPGRIALCA